MNDVLDLYQDHVSGYDTWQMFLDHRFPVALYKVNGYFSVPEL